MICPNLYFGGVLRPPIYCHSEVRGNRDERIRGAWLYKGGIIPYLCCEPITVGYLYVVLYLADSCRLEQSERLRIGFWLTSPARAKTIELRILYSRLIGCLIKRMMTTRFWNAITGQIVRIKIGRKLKLHWVEKKKQLHQEELSRWTVGFRYCRRSVWSRWRRQNSCRGGARRLTLTVDQATMVYEKRCCLRTTRIKLNDN